MKLNISMLRVELRILDSLENPVIKLYMHYGFSNKIRVTEMEM